MSRSGSSAFALGRNIRKSLNAKSPKSRGTTSTRMKTSPGARSRSPRSGHTTTSGTSSSSLRFTPPRVGGTSGTHRSMYECPDSPLTTASPRTQRTKLRQRHDHAVEVTMRKQKELVSAGKQQAAMFSPVYDAHTRTNSRDDRKSSSGLSVRVKTSGTDNTRSRINSPKYGATRLSKTTTTTSVKSATTTSSGSKVPSSMRVNTNMGTSSSTHTPPPKSASPSFQTSVAHRQRSRIKRTVSYNVQRTTPQTASPDTGASSSSESGYSVSTPQYLPTANNVDLYSTPDDYLVENMSQVTLSTLASSTTTDTSREQDQKDKYVDPHADNMRVKNTNVRTEMFGGILTYTSEGRTYTPPRVSDIQDEFVDFDPFVFIKSLPPLPDSVRLRRPGIPKKDCDFHHTLVLDLDETLVHCSVVPFDNPDITFVIRLQNMVSTVYVRLRPGLNHFLETVSKWFEVVLFTASQSFYANKLLEYIDPKRKYIKHRLFRQSCAYIQGNYLKDLHILGRDLSRTAIIDNSVQAFSYQLNNGIPIESWFDDPSDQELTNLLPFLEKLRDCKDVRPLIRDTFRLQEFVDSLVLRNTYGSYGQY